MNEDYSKITGCNYYLLKSAYSDLRDHKYETVFYMAPELINYYDFRNDAEMLSTSDMYRDMKYQGYFDTEIGKYYSQKDLSFMRFQDAERVCEDILDYVGFPYANVVGYACDSDSMNHFFEDHRNRLLNFSIGEDSVITASTEWNDISMNEFYTFYIPMDTGIFHANEQSIINRSLYARISIDQDGIFDLSIPAKIVLKGSRPVSVMKPEPLIEKSAAFYNDLGLDANICIEDAQLLFSFLGNDPASEKLIDYTDYYGPVWEIRARIQQGDSTMTDVIRYNAVTGDRLD